MAARERVSDSNYMSTELEIVLRVPKAKDPIRDASGYPIDNSSVRFIKRIVVDSLPKVGDLLPLTTKSGEAFDGSITRVQWHDEKNMFVVYCQYSKKSMLQQQYVGIFDDPEWEMKPLI
jgi:hypothetical protein